MTTISKSCVKQNTWQIETCKTVL